MSVPEFFQICFIKFNDSKKEKKKEDGEDRSRSKVRECNFRRNDRERIVDRCKNIFASSETRAPFILRSLVWKYILREEWTMRRWRCRVSAGTYIYN